MSSEITTALMTLAGTLVGGAITLYGQWLINKQQSKKEYIKLATELATQERERLTKIKEEGTIFHPIESFISYYLKYFELMEEKKLDVKNLKELEDFRIKIYAYYEESTDDSNTVKVTPQS